MKTIRFFLSLLLALNFACDNDVTIIPPGGNNCLSGEGAIVLESRNLANFNSINNTIFADILLTQGPQEEVIIEAQQNVLDQVKTEVNNDELMITVDQCVDIDQPVKLQITIPEIESLTLTGVGNIIAQNELTLMNLGVVLTGVGDFDLQGTAAILDITMTGVGDVRAFKLNTDTCDIDLTGTGDAEVFVNDELNVTITGTGTVFYKGEASISSNITGAGSIVDSN